MTKAIEKDVISFVDSISSVELEDNQQVRKKVAMLKCYLGNWNDEVLESDIEEIEQLELPLEYAI